MAITRALADTYFDVESNVHGHVWLGFSEQQRDAAIIHCIREFQRIFQGNYDDDATTYDDFPRMDIAVYEQALDLLLESGIGNADRSAPRYTGIDDVQLVRDFELSQNAKKWLYARGGNSVEIVLG